MPIKNTIIYKTLFMLTLIITLFAMITLFYMYQNNVQISKRLVTSQKEYISQHLLKEENRLKERELKYIQEHALSIVDSVKNALLYNLDQDIIKETVKVFMKQKSIQAIYIFDDITEETYLGLVKKEGRVIQTEDDLNSTNRYKMLKYPLEIDGNNFGYLKVYYDVVPLMHKIKIAIKKGKQEDYSLINQQADILKKDIRSYIITNIIMFILFILTILLTMMLIFTKYIHNPLHIVQKNLHQFFEFFRDVKSDLRLINISSNDELGEMSREINANIQTALEMHHEIEDTQKEILITMGTVAEMHSEETGNHVKRVAKYSELFARYYGLSKVEIKRVKDASSLHDIGKIAIPDYILNKAGELNKEEFEIMKGHTLLGYNMLKHSNKSLLKAAATIAYEHHEKYDGSGYPRGLKGEDIHIYGRILALADVFDALGSDRVYKKAWDDERIFALLREESGRHFDPKLIDIFFDHIDDFLKIRAMFSDRVV